MPLSKHLLKRLPKRLNLGCGLDHRVGYWNVDIDPRVRPDEIVDVRKKLPYANNSLAEIVAQDIFEHLTLADAKSLLIDCHRILKKNCGLVIRVPNPDAIIDKFQHDPETRNLFIYGDTSQSGEWGSHKQGYTKPLLKRLLSLTGFNIITFKTIDTNFEVYAKKGSIPHLDSLLFINYSLGFGGAEVFNSDLLALIRSLGTNVRAYVLNDQFYRLLVKKKVSSDYLKTKIDLNGNWRGLIKSLLLLPFALKEIIGISWQHKNYQTILLTSFAEKILFTGVAKLLKWRVVWIEFGPLSPVFGKMLGIPKLLYRCVSHLPDSVIVPSRHTLNDVIPHGKISRGKTVIIPCGRLFKQVVRRPTKDNSFILLCVSRLESGKGQNVLIEAWSQIYRQMPNAKLRIVGTGDQEDRLKALIKEHKAEHCVELAGFVSNIDNEYQNADAVVFPSQWNMEGFGLTTIEAMHYGKPVVAFQTGPTPEIVSHMYDGLLVETRTGARGLANTIYNLYSNKSLQRKLGNNAKRTAMKYKLQLLVDQYLKQLIST